MRNTFADTMLEVGRFDPKLVVLVGDISHFALQPFAESCPGRFYNVGICEPTIVSMAAGLSHTGYHPVVHTIAPFLIERSFEQIKLDVDQQKANVKLVGFADYPTLGPTHSELNGKRLMQLFNNITSWSAHRPGSITFISTSSFSPRV